MTTEQQAHYDLCVSNGCTPMLAEMLALQQPPMSDSEREWAHGRCNENQFENQDFVGNHHRKLAKKAGVNPKGKFYVSGLATYPGDPRAWVSSRDEVKSICEKNGWGCRGAVNVARRTDEAPPAPIDVADDLVESYAKQAIAKDPGLAEKPFEEVKHQTKQRIKGKVKR